MSGETVCGVLIGSSIAIGLRCGQGKEGIPEEDEAGRNQAIQSVRELYRDFLQEFGSTHCKTLSKCDWSDSEDLARWIQNKGWKSTCDVYLKYTMNKCVEMAEERKL